MRKLLITLIVVAVILIGADIGGRLLAEHQAAKAVAQQLHGTAVDVDIHGVSFLYQAATGHYEQVTVTAPDVSAGTARDVACTIDLRDVRLPLADAIRGNVDRLTAETGHLHAVIPAASIAPAASALKLTVTGGAGNDIDVTASVPIAGAVVPVNARLRMSVHGDTLTATVRSVEIAGLGVGAALGPAKTQVTAQLNRWLSENLALRVPMDMAAFPLTSVTVSAKDGDLLVDADARDLAASALVG